MNPSMTHLDNLITRYVGERLQRGEITRLTARSITNHLRSFSESHGNRTLQQLGPKAVDKWLGETTDHAPSTRAGALSSLRNFARWLVLHDMIRKDFTLTTPRLRRRRVTAPTMTAEDALLTLSVCNTDRERLIVWLMFGAGLRCVEVSRLNVDDYDSQSHTLHVTGKAGHERTVPLGRPIWQQIDLYLWRHSIACGPLVQREDDRPGHLGPERISGIVGKLVRKAGVKQRNYDGRGAHGFRACAASDLLEACDGDLAVVADFLGHQGYGNLNRYLRRRQLGKVRDAVDLRWAS